MTAKAKILVVDDQVAVTAKIRFLLTRAGCETQGALDTKTALRLAQTQVFDLITLDMDMPGSFEVCSSLRENPFFQTPIVFVSTKFCEDNVQRGRDLGVADFIQEPFGASDFISRLLSHARQDEEITCCAP
jgi:two-component system, OmpR family, alkaline phosphatase synthesis response regulator PhoP